MPSFRPLPPGCTFWQPSTLLATVGGIGLIRVASGTWGSLAALPLAWLLWRLGGPAAVAIAGVVIGLVGIWAAGAVCRGGEADSSAIVIDEVAGQLLALAPVAGLPWLYPLAFALFRLLDIAKPWPISWLDHELGGGWGVMMDDIAAGAATAAVCAAVLAGGLA
jgi:phosphatidylglycerophosphatase A